MNTDDVSQISAETINALARAALPGMLAYFDSAEGRKEYQKWQQAQGDATECA